MPNYRDKSDYNTNAPTYYDDLARKNELMKYLAKRVWEYDKAFAERIEQWDENLETLPDDLRRMLEEWMEDGTLDHIINDTIFSWKADKTYVDSELDKKADITYVANELVRINKTLDEKANTQFTTITVLIPSDFPNLQTAVNELSKIKVNHGTIFDLVIESGHLLESGLTLANGDYGYFKISSIDPVVTVADSFTGRIVSCDHTIAPVLNITIDGKNLVDRVYSMMNSTGKIMSGSGGKNITGRALYLNNSQVSAGGTIWENIHDQIYLSAGSSLQFGNGKIINSTVSGNGAIAVSRTSNLEAQNLRILGAVIGIEAKRGASVNCHFAVFEDIEKMAIMCWRASQVSCDDTSFRRMGEEAIRCESGIVSASRCYMEGTPSNMTAGITVMGGNVNAPSSTITKFNDGVYCREGGVARIDVSNVSYNRRHGCLAEKSGTISASNGTVKGNAGSDLYCSLGGIIVANNTETSTGTPSISDTNLLGGFNEIGSNRGIIWA